MEVSSTSLGASVFVDTVVPVLLLQVYRNLMHLQRKMGDVKTRKGISVVVLVLSGLFFGTRAVEVSFVDLHFVLFRWPSFCATKPERKRFAFLSGQENS